jgi:hypothetical protein
MESKLLLELACELLELLDVLPRVMNLQRLWMNFAQGDVKVLVLLVVVADCDVLVLFKARGFDGAAHHKFELPFTQ